MYGRRRYFSPFFSPGNGRTNSFFRVEHRLLKSHAFSRTPHDHLSQEQIARRLRLMQAKEYLPTAVPAMSHQRYGQESSPGSATLHFVPAAWRKQCRRSPVKKVSFPPERKYSPFPPYISSPHGVIRFRPVPTLSFASWNAGSPEKPPEEGIAVAKSLSKGRIRAFSCPHAFFSPFPPRD